MKDTNSTVGTGPCAKWFKGEECPFYPEVTIRQEFKVSCKDAEDSYCECIWFCWNNKDVYEMFDSALKSEEYDDCTTRLTFFNFGWLTWLRLKALRESEKIIPIVSSKTSLSKVAVCSVIFTRVCPET